MNEPVPQQVAASALPTITTPPPARAPGAAGDYLAAFPESRMPAERERVLRPRMMRALPRVSGATLK